MSILIKGMEMPNTCQICRAARLDRLIDCEEFDRLSIAQRMYKRSETCPLVPVPPHGRCIDADELLKRAIGTKCFHGDYALMLEELVGESTTIIPASQEGKG